MEVEVTYLCPIRSEVKNSVAIDEFSRYWEFLISCGCEVIVIDGSPPDIFEEHHLRWSHIRHERVDNSFGYLNGKVNAVWT